MPVDRQHLRLLSRSLYGTVALGTVKAAVGAAVPSGKRRHIHYSKVWHDGTSGDGSSHVVFLYRDGATGASALDVAILPGTGSGNFANIGDPSEILALNIDTPIYILESGETLGIGVLASVGADNAYILVNYFDEP
jgi:hypothetical protein